MISMSGVTVYRPLAWRFMPVMTLIAWLGTVPVALALQPGSVKATYDIYKGSLKIARVEESFAREDGHYSVTSTTHATGLLALFRPGSIVISSNGMIREQGLRPLSFSDRRDGDSSRNRNAEFDWANGKLTLVKPDQRTAVALPDDTQDRLSAMYQFMFLPLEKMDTLSFHMTNGSKLDIYNYRITHGQSVTVPLGTFKASYVSSVPEPGTSRTEIWLAEEHANFPYKMVITDPDGDKITQELTRFDLTP